MFSFLLGASPSGSGSVSGRVAASHSRRRSGFPGLRFATVLCFIPLRERRLLSSPSIPSFHSTNHQAPPIPRALPHPIKARPVKVFRPLPKPSVSALASPISRHRQSASHLVYPASRTSLSCWHPLLRSAPLTFLPTHTTSLGFVVKGGRPFVV